MRYPPWAAPWIWRSARRRSSITGLACVNRIYTDLAVIDVAPEGLVVIDMAPGLTLDELTEITGIPLANGIAAQAA
jgi:acyl CoA:acetate/3-ketoacid CoA transferase beta subunit